MKNVRFLTITPPPPPPSPATKKKHEVEQIKIKSNTVIQYNINHVSADLPYIIYLKDPDKMANRVDPDQIAPSGSGSTLFMQCAACLSDFLKTLYHFHPHSTFPLFPENRKSILSIIFLW